MNKVLNKIVSSLIVSVFSLSAFAQGNGSDGSLTVSSTSYTDAVRSAVSTTSNSGQAVLSVSSVSGFSAGQTVLVIQMLGTGAGQYEEKTISSVGGSSLTFSSNLIYTYTNGANDKAQVLKVNQYTSVTVNNGGVLTCSAFDGSTGGIVYFKASGTVTVNSDGKISASEKGFPGGTGGTGGWGGTGGAWGFGGTSSSPQGKNGGVSSYGGLGGQLGNKGGNGAATGYSGSEGSEGAEGQGNGAGDSAQSVNNSNQIYWGVTHGNSLFLGSSGEGGYGGRAGDGGGGGGGGGYGNGTGQNGQSGTTGENGSVGGNGGAGGGILIIQANTITGSGTIESKGQNGSNGNTGANGGAGGNGGNKGAGGTAGGGGGGRGGMSGCGSSGGNGGAGGALWVVVTTNSFSGTELTNGGTAGTQGAVGSGGAQGLGGTGSTGSNGQNGGTGVSNTQCINFTVYNGGTGKSKTCTPTPGISTWTGAIDTDWTKAGNWDGCGDGVPTSTSEVVIPDGLTNYPVINSNITVKKITVNGTGNYTVNPNYEITLTQD